MQLVGGMSAAASACMPHQVPPTSSCYQGCNAAASHLQAVQVLELKLGAAGAGQAAGWKLVTLTACQAAARNAAAAAKGAWVAAVSRRPQQLVLLQKHERLLPQRQQEQQQQLCSRMTTAPMGWIITTLRMC